MDSSQRQKEASYSPPTAAGTILPISQVERVSPQGNVASALLSSSLSEPTAQLSSVCQNRGVLRALPVGEGAASSVQGEEDVQRLRVSALEWATVSYQLERKRTGR